MEILHTTNEEPFVSGTGHFAGWENRLMKLGRARGWGTRAPPRPKPAGTRLRTGRSPGRRGVGGRSPRRRRGRWT